MVISSRVVALCAYIKEDICGDSESVSSDKEASLGIGGVVSADNGEDHWGCLFALPLFRFNEPAAGSVEDDP